MMVLAERMFARFRPALILASTEEIMTATRTIRYQAHPNPIWSSPTITSPPSGDIVLCYISHDPRFAGPRPPLVTFVLPLVTSVPDSSPEARP